MGICRLTCDLILNGMQTPIIKRNHGNTKSAKCNPFQTACSIHQYLPPPLLTKIIKTIATPRKMSKLLSRFFVFVVSSSVSDDDSWIGFSVASCALRGRDI